MIKRGDLIFQPRQDGFAVYKGGSVIGNVTRHADGAFTFVESGHGRIYLKDRQDIAEFMRSLAIAKSDERQRELRTSRWNG